MNLAAFGQIRISYFVAPLAAGVLYYLSRVNYLLFHGLAEIFSVVIAGGVAMIAWNSRYLLQRHFLLFIGLGYPFVGLLAVLHTFSYKGLSVFPAEAGANLPTQLWIATRYLECCTFLAAGHFLEHRLRPGLAIAGYTLVTGTLLASIFIWPVFPDCYLEGTGLTDFKKASEILISLVWFLVILILLAHRKKFDRPVLRQLLLAVGLNIAAELSFTFYFDVYGLLNFTGHFLRLLAVYFIYRAIIEKSLLAPYHSLFRELNLSEQRFRTIYETAPLALVIWDEQFRITQWNEAASRIFGWTEQEALGRNYFELLFPEEERPEPGEIIKGLQQETPAGKSVNRCLTKSGRSIICAWNSALFQDQEGKFTEVLSLGLDITEQKKAADSLRQHSEMIKHFAYSVAHDLKSPASSLTALADLFHRKYGEALDDRGRLFCDQIKQVSMQISALVQNINTYIVAKELPLKLESVDLQVLLGILRDEFAARVTERGMRWIEPDNPQAIRADQTALLRILRNLVDNALKYGGPDMRRIEIGYHETTENHELSIRDDGVGLPPGAEEKIFELFQRGGNSTGTSGAGLGLAICRELAEKMGGSIRAVSPADRGAAFFLSIPRDPQ